MGLMAISLSLHPRSLGKDLHFLLSAMFYCILLGWLLLLFEIRLTFPLNAACNHVFSN